MSAEKVSYGPIETGTPSRGERAAWSRVSLVGVFGAVALVTAAAVLAMVLNNMSQQMARDHEEIMILKTRVEKDRLETMALMESLIRSEEPDVSVRTADTEDVPEKRSRRSASNWDELLTKISNLRGDLESSDSDAPEAQDTPVKRGQATGGAIYIRWGRKACPSTASTIYSGVAGGSDGGETGGGTNYLCLPKNPEWGKYQDGLRWMISARVYGAQYKLLNPVPFSSTPRLHDQHVPCAVCHNQRRSNQLMIPARKTCPAGWFPEYDGYLMAGAYKNPAAKEFVCMDKTPEVEKGGENKDGNGALFYPAEAACGSLACPPYVDGRELTCVVCSQ
ncbi:Hypp4135 [Branchiostoma lanceolatum]|uniref:Hypp4135 protein n=1 Tax=Branchiostoma lanceolatum TaxID=7740 RepID=A0A8K0EZV4_BRALA|nr:Hypp4135 [Branchiostoma lanceolatum]